jgi:hypothetical protein
VLAGQRARQIRDEEERSFQGGYEDRVPAGVVGRDLFAELGDARPQLLCGKVRLADP